MIKHYRQLIILTLVLLLGGCSLLSPVEVKPTNKYVLTLVPDRAAHANIHGKILLVTAPETEPFYNTTQMAYSVHHFQVAYFGQNEWAATPGQMLQPLLVKTLQNTGAFKAIVTPPYMGVYDYILNTQIIKLVQDFTCHPAMLEFTVRAQLIRTTTNRVIATKEFNVEQPLIRISPYAGVIAANIAADRMLGEISTFTLRHTR